MVVDCEQVWREVSNYLDGDVEPGLRTAMDEHFRSCQRCAAVLEGTRNVVQLYSDERMLEVPLGFGRRLERRLVEESMPASRRNFLGWLVAAATALLVAGGIELSRTSQSEQPALRSQLAQPAVGVPPGLMVVVAEEGRMFHLAGCDFIHGKTKLRTMPASEAMQEGYAPCIRCLKKYLETSAG
jgi:anti-sigma factor RsiW